MVNAKRFIKNSSVYAKMKFMFGKSDFGKIWRDKSNDWYEDRWESATLLKENFKNYFNEKKDVKTILDIGCGTASFPIKFPEMFTDKKYVGIDISKSAIEYCKKNSTFEFI